MTNSTRISGLIDMFTKVSSPNYVNIQENVSVNYLVHKLLKQQETNMWSPVRISNVCNNFKLSPRISSEKDYAYKTQDQGRSYGLPNLSEFNAQLQIGHLSLCLKTSFKYFVRTSYLKRSVEEDQIALQNPLHLNLNAVLVLIEILHRTQSCKDLAEKKTEFHFTVFIYEPYSHFVE